ncbi:C3a anaphylatoxin chemotactic receptor isoform X2 [Amia ocellicauda]
MTTTESSTMTSTDPTVSTSTDYSSTAYSSTTYSSTAHHPASILQYPSMQQKANISDLTAASDITSRANYCYMFFILAGLCATVFIFYTFLHAYRTRRALSKVDSFFGALCISDLFVILYSLSAVAHRPKYLETTGLGCAILSFFFNVAHLSSQFLQVLAVSFVMYDEIPQGPTLVRRLLDSGPACAALTAAMAALFSMLLAGLLGFQDLLHNNLHCQLDPLQAVRAYDITKFCIAFAIPQVVLLLTCFVACTRSGGSAWSKLKACPASLAVSLLTLLCRLFYYCVLLHRTSQKYGWESGSPQQEALMNVAEFVLFSGSCLDLVLVVFLYEPCRDRLQVQLRDCCHRLRGREANRNIMTPHIEIADMDEALDLDPQEGQTGGASTA